MSEIISFPAAQPRISRAHVADTVEYLNGKGPKESAEFVERLPLEWAVDVLDLPTFEWASEVLEQVPADKAVALLEGMSADRAADMLRWVNADTRTALEARLSPETRAAITHLLTYPEDTAGSLMTTEFVTVPANWTVERTLEHVRAVERTRETIYAIYVLDPVTKRLQSTVTLRRLISGAPDAPITSVAQPYAPITTTPLASSEDVARLIAKYDLLAIPVVDSTGHLIGICTFDDVIDAMIEDQTEDVQRMGGMEAIDEPYMQITFAEMIKKRAGWLCILFISEMFTASAMQAFSDELEKAIVLALFVPLVMSSGGNSGSQATSLIIRALALHQVRLKDWFRVAVREIPTGMMLGAILGVLGMVRIMLWQGLGLFDYGPHWQLLAVTIAAALVGIVTFGSLAGSMLPFILKRVGFDPASASAPFVATLVDVTGLVIYFSVAYLFLKGTIL
ncbi:magnesium transporter MgtE [Azorhizobium oxalatiphilum]|uniref:Magnesium transporter MgtE n=1 Tax=Azorhizobium oxalatiphilum TaxID=980631 RepID=A0A917C767_9HYPH|nr:magnesium transporter [Azorhizobium oxalatiphilum]GGF72209.1 magnesium transporter MgtE [Azorhizobium oxalatiphilum]